MYTQCIALTIIFGTVAAIQFENDDLPNGILFLNVNNAYVVKNTRQLEYHLSLDHFVNQTKTLQSCTNKIYELCSTDRASNCDYFGKYLNETINNFEKENNKIKLYANRTKRSSGWFFNLITILINVFTTFINMNDNKVNTLIYKQLYEKHLLILNNSVYIQREANIQLMERVNELSELVSNNTREININNLIQLSISTISDFHRIMDIILDVLQNNREDKLLSLIGLENIQNDLNEIANTYQANTSMNHIDFITNPLEILRISKIKSSYFNQSLIIKLRTPVIGEKYELYKMIPIPIEVGGSVQLVHVRKPFIISNKKHYMLYSREQLRECNKLLNGELICIPEDIIFNKKECEGEILLHGNPFWCKFKAITPQNYIIHVVNGTFYGIIFHPMDFKVKPPNSIEITATMTKNAWFHVEAGSIVKIGDKEIHVEFETQTDLLRFVSPKVILPNLNIYSKLSPNLNEIVVKDYQLKYDDLKTELDELKEHGEKILYVPLNESLFSFITESIQLVLLLVVSFIVIILMCCQCCRE